MLGILLGKEKEPRILFMYETIGGQAAKSFINTKLVLYVPDLYVAVHGMY